MLVCNNGGGGGNFSKVKWSFTKRIGTRNRTDVILETQELCPKAYLTHKPTYAYLPLFISS